MELTNDDLERKERYLFFISANFRNLIEKKIKRKFSSNSRLARENRSKHRKVLDCINGTRGIACSITRSDSKAKRRN